jgi:hypothetical protein
VVVVDAAENHDWPGNLTPLNSPDMKGIGPLMREGKDRAEPREGAEES